MKVYLAEAIATFALVFVGAGAILAGASLVGVALAHGLILMCMVYATAHISGGHVNPAVTISMWVTKQIKGAVAIGYIIAQLVGAVVAGIVLKSIYPSARTLGDTTLATGISPGIGTMIEIILTFFLVFTIFGVAVDKKAPPAIYGAAIGLVLTAAILVGGPLTGASLNPARTFGPAFATGIWNNHIVYWIGPIVGGIIAAVTYKGFLLKKRKSK